MPRVSMGEAKRPRSGVKSAPKISADRLRKLLLLAKADAGGELDLPNALQFEGLASSDEEVEKVPSQNLKKNEAAFDSVLNRDDQENQLNFEFSFMSSGTANLQLDDDGNEKNSILDCHSPKSRLSLGISDGASLLLSIEDEEEYDEEDDKHDFKENLANKSRPSSIGKSSFNAPSSKFKLNDDGVSEYVSDDVTKHKNLRMSFISAGGQDSLGFSVEDSEERNPVSIKKKKVSFGGVNLESGYESPSYDYQESPLKTNSAKKKILVDDHLSVKNYESERNEMDAVAAALIASPDHHDYGMNEDNNDVGDDNDLDLYEPHNVSPTPVLASSRNSSSKRNSKANVSKVVESRKKLFVESDNDNSGSEEEDYDEDIEVDESAYSEFRPQSNFSDHDGADSLISDESEDDNTTESPADTKKRKRRKSTSSLASVTSPYFDGKKYKRKPGRETMFLVQKAQEVHAVLDSPDHDDGVRRSARQRTKPLKFWKNERVIYHTTNDGLGAIMPVPCEEVRRSDSDSEQQLNSRRGARKPQKRILKDFVSDLSRVTEGVLKVQDEKGRAHEVSVGATEGMISYQSIESGASKNSESDVCAAKFFETDSFTNGMVIIPAACTKNSEVVLTPEVFFVRSCPEEGIIVTMNDQKHAYGAGDSFWVPAGVEYSIENLSEKRDAQLFFVVTYNGENVEVKPKKKRKSNTFAHSSTR